MFIHLCLPPFGSQLVCFLFEIWGKDVDKFRPERWLDEEGRVRSVPEFIPFGIGKILFPCTRCHPYKTTRLMRLTLEACRWITNLILTRVWFGNFWRENRTNRHSCGKMVAKRTIISIMKEISPCHRIKWLPHSYVRDIKFISMMKWLGELFPKPVGNSNKSNKNATIFNL